MSLRCGWGWLNTFHGCGASGLSCQADATRLRIWFRLHAFAHWNAPINFRSERT
jgi:hypothetical protein